MRSKQELKALRELAGISQSALARELGVQDRAVRRWESMTAPQEAPQDAWDILDEMLEQQERIVSSAIKMLYEIKDKREVEDVPIVLPYWMSQEDYLEHSTDARLGVDRDDGWRIANATSRAMYVLLRDLGFDVSWVAGEDAPTAKIMDSSEED